MVLGRLHGRRPSPKRAPAHKMNTVYNGTHTHIASLPWICVRASTPQAGTPLGPWGKADKFLIWRSKGKAS